MKRQPPRISDYARFDAVMALVRAEKLGLHNGRHGRFGAQRCGRRAVAAHMMREAYGVSVARVAAVARISRPAVQQAWRRWWDRRDNDPDLDNKLQDLIDQLKQEETLND